MHARRVPRSLLLAVLLSLAAGAHSRVVVFEAGAGEVSHADSSQYTGQAFVVMDQGPGGEVLQTLMTVETWTGAPNSNSMLKALTHLLRPVSWVFEQLEAIDAMQQASVNTFLMRHNEASLGGLTHAQAAAQGEQQGDEASSSMQDKLQHLGCQRFSAAMDEYIEGLDAALDVRTIEEVVDRSNRLWALEAQLQVQEEEHNEVEHGSADEAMDVLHTSEMLIITSSTESQDYEWDTLEVVTDAQKAYADYLLDKKRPQQHQLSHQLQLDEKSPGPLLRGTSHWWSDPFQDDGDSVEEELEEQVPERAASSARGSAAAGRFEDLDTDDAFLALLEPEADESLHTQPSRAQHSRPRSHSVDQLRHQQPHHQAFKEDGSDVYSFEQLPQLDLGGDQDWPVLVLLILAASAVAVAFVVSWMQLQAIMHKGRHLSVPVMVKHKGRLVWGMVVVSEDEVCSSNSGCKDT